MSSCVFTPARRCRPGLSLSHLPRSGERRRLAPRQLLQPEPFRSPGQGAAPIVPGAKHDTARGPAVELELVYRRSVSMTVDQGAHAAGAHSRGDRGLIGVHDLAGGALGMALAALARLLGEAAPNAKRQVQEAPLPALAAH